MLGLHPPRAGSSSEPTPARVPGTFTAFLRPAGVRGLMQRAHVRAHEVRARSARLRSTMHARVVAVAATNEPRYGACAHTQNLYHRWRNEQRRDVRHDVAANTKRQHTRDTKPGLSKTRFCSGPVVMACELSHQTACDNSLLHRRPSLMTVKVPRRSSEPNTKAPGANDT